MRLLILALALLSSGCVRPVAATRPRLTDTSKPEDVLEKVDYSLVFDGMTQSRSVYARGAKWAALQRVMLSPNIVFESSRSSLAEPGTKGPASGLPDMPSFGDALGASVSFTMSTTLLRYLTDRGAQAVVPAYSTVFQAGCARTDPIAACDPAGAAECPKCAPASWVERVLLASARPPGKRGEGVLPTAALAVRELGLTLVKTEVVVSRVDNKLVVMPRKTSGDESLCDRMELQVPAVTFAAELVDPVDGRLLARILERRPQLPGRSSELERIILTTAWRPVRAAGHTRYQGQKPVKTSKYDYVAGWERFDATCNSVARAFDAVYEDSMRAFDEGPVGEKIIAKALEPLN